MKTTLEKLEAARATRPPGYVDALLAAGEVHGAELHISREALNAIQSHYGVTPATAARTVRATDAPPMRGLGDLISKVATPIARALGLPCIDPSTRDVRPQSPCAQRRDALNAALPFSATPPT